MVRVELAFAERPLQVQTVALQRVELAVQVDERDRLLAGLDRGYRAGRDVLDLGDGDELHAGSDATKCYPRTAVATILLAGVDLFIRSKLESSLPGHHLVTTESVDPPDLVIADVARLDPYDVADQYPDVPLLGFTNHKDTAGLRRANEAGFDQVVAKSALDERAQQLIDELLASLD